MRSVMLVVMVIAIGCVSTGGLPPMRPVQVVSHVDVSRYLGTWYEIARYPNRFQRHCVDSTAHYQLRDDGDIEVTNRCTDERDGTTRSSKGKAWIVDKATNARLKVRFFWPFSGDYWIIDLDPDYRFAVVGEPNREYLWILAREPELPPDVYAGIGERLRAQGFDPARLIVNRRAAR